VIHGRGRSAGDLFLEQRAAPIKAAIPNPFGVMCAPLSVAYCSTAVAALDETPAASVFARVFQSIRFILVL
jgi:hypothetical protein